MSTWRLWSTKNFINSTTVAQALYEFVTGDLLPLSGMSTDAIAASRYALNCQDPDIIVDLRKLNGRPKNDLFDPFWAKMAVIIDGRVDDRRHGELLVCMHRIALYVIMFLTISTHLVVYVALTGDKFFCR